MKKSKIENVYLHNADKIDNKQIANFHINIISRQMNELNLSTDEKIAIIDKIIRKIKNSFDKL